MRLRLYSPAVAQKDSPKRPAMETFNASNAGGLSGSELMEKIPFTDYPEAGYNIKNLESELSEIKALAQAARERHRRERNLE